MGDFEELKKIEREKRIKAEIKRLEKLFTGIEARTKKAVKSLIENAAFMAITLEDLQDEMNANGCISKYQNGENQWGTKKSPEADIYISMSKNLMSATKQLTDLLPSDGKGAKEKPDEFLKLLGRGKRG